MSVRIRLGTIGWNYPEWRGSVYLPKAKPQDFLTEYAQRFPIVEAASSAYGMPRTEVVAKWAAATPDDFEISLKVPDWIVRKKANDPDLLRALDVLLTHLAPLHEAGKLGTLVAQFHPSFRRDKKAEHLASFVHALPEGPHWAIELRDDSWWREETYALLRDAGVTLVWSALQNEVRTPPIATTSTLYIRLFGERDLEAPFDAARRDATPELSYWVERITTAAPAIERIDVLVSKYLEGYAPGTVEKLARMLGFDRSASPATSRQLTLDAL